MEKELGGVQHPSTRRRARRDGQQDFKSGDRRKIFMKEEFMG